MKTRFLIFSLIIAAVSCSGPKDGVHKLHILTTNDVHSTWFDSTYTGDGVKKSLYAMNYYIDSVRLADGAENVLLVDAGDCLQGDNAAYYFNYVDTVTPHLYPRLVEYMKYDAVAVGNHDIETGHPVYDRVTRDLKDFGVPFLGANAIRNDNGRPYFPSYTVVKRAGLKVAILGYTNANMKAWLTESLWSGMHFVKIADIIQDDVDMVRAKTKPDVMVVLVHSGSGLGDGKILENEALDLFNSVKGVDVLVNGHDHRPYTEARDSICLLNSGSHSRFVGHGIVTVNVEKGKVASKTYETGLIAVDAAKADPAMREHFKNDFEAVKAFTLKEIGVLNTELRTRDSYKGMCDYMNLIHTVSLGCSPAEISFAAPLTYNGIVKAGILKYNDLFTIYPFENQLFVVKMTGAQIKNYLEYSYGTWIKTMKSPLDHILNIRNTDDPRTQQKGWSFVARSYNFDSAAGIIYEVDVTKPEGERVIIKCMANGAEFDMNRTYNVAMTSYRASGGGMLMHEGAGIDTDKIDELVVERYPEIRNLIYDYLMKNGSIDPETIGDKSVIGEWKFVPEKMAVKALDRDMALLFR